MPVHEISDLQFAKYDQIKCSMLNVVVIILLITC